MWPADAWTSGSQPSSGPPGVVSRSRRYVSRICVYYRDRKASVKPVIPYIIVALSLAMYRRQALCAYICYSDV